MALDPLTGLDPSAPPTTLRKEVRYEYIPPPPPPPPPASPTYSASLSGGGGGSLTLNNTYVLIDANGVPYTVTAAEFANSVDTSAIASVFIGLF